MTTNRPTHSLPLLPLIISGIVILVGLILLGAAIYFVAFPPAGASPGLTPTPPLEVTRPVMFPTATTAPTDTPVPTATPTPTEQPTQPPTPSATTPPLVQPTSPIVATNPPPPTAPPTATTASSSHGLTGVSFSVENPTVGANQQIWFNFSVTNGSGQVLPYGFLGVAIFNSTGTNVGFHTSWSGSSLNPGQTLNWRDGLVISTAGSYQLQLSICYSSVTVCGSGGEWELLGPRVPVTVN
jgi:hypothetical protein